MMKRKLLILLAFFLLAPMTVQASPKNLQRFFKQVHTFSARFNQVVLDEGLNRLQESSGTLYIQRPGKFRWNYDSPLKQHIIADGKKLWVYDVELQQVVVRKLTGSLGHTPAILLAGKGMLSGNFKVRRMDNAGKLQWVRMTPKHKDGGYEDIQIGFENGRLRTLTMIDGFGRTIRITFYQTKENKRISPKQFIFKAPANVDIIGQ